MAMKPRNPSGRPKASPSELLLRRIGKHFESSDQLLAKHKTTESELREQGQGKQPFNSYIKSLQDRLSMYDSYLKLLSTYADDAGYSIDTDVIIKDEDKERPWSKLRAHFRDPDGNKLSLDDELKERRKVFDGSRHAYNKSYPYIEWCGFWFETEVNAAHRLSTQAIMSFDLIGVNYLTLDQCLATNEAKKGRETYINKQGVNARDAFTHIHSDIIRHKTRLRKALAELDLNEDVVDHEYIDQLLASDDKVIAKKGRQLKKLMTKIESMESDLKERLEKASFKDQLKFDITLLKKDRLPLIKLKNANKITPIQRVKLANLDNDIEVMKALLSNKEKQAV